MIPSTRRTRVVAALVVVAAVASLVAFFVIRSGDGGSEGDGQGARPELDPASGRRNAATACGHFDRFLELVEADARADEVFDVLDEAQDAAAAAARFDPTWIDLSGGLGGLEVGFRNNDAEASRLSVTVVRSACERLSNWPSPKAAVFRRPASGRGGRRSSSTRRSGRWPKPHWTRA